jgi:hypothetical protein
MGWSWRPARVAVTHASVHAHLRSHVHARIHLSPFASPITLTPSLRCSFTEGACPLFRRSITVKYDGVSVWMDEQPRINKIGTWSLATLTFKDRVLMCTACFGWAADVRSRASVEASLYVISIRSGSAGSVRRSSCLHEASHLSILLGDANACFRARQRQIVPSTLHGPLRV